MSVVWVVFPSIRPLAELDACLRQWKSQGYGVAILRQGELTDLADLQIPIDSYLGWSRGINILAREVLRRDSECAWVVGAADDIFPDPTKTAPEIALECCTHFRELNGPQVNWNPATWGVMQPTGDLKAWPGSHIDKFAGSPWLGKSWCQRAYLGDGPMPTFLFHNFSDEECQCVAQMHGVFWQRPDLTHYHNHPLRNGGEWPPHLQPINTRAAWNEAKAIFEERRAKGFPGSGVIV